MRTRVAELFDRGVEALKLQIGRGRREKLLAFLATHLA
jgi:hypothetical protein